MYERNLEYVRKKWIQSCLFESPPKDGTKLEKMKLLQFENIFEVS